MKTVAATIGQALILLILAIGIGLGANSLRSKNQIKLTRNYSPALPRPANPAGHAPFQDHPEPYGVVSVAEVARSVNDPNRAGLDVILDARNESTFARGHIPGAILCDPYDLERYIDVAAGLALGAQRVIVYCHGGNCEDSYLLCQELIAYGVPRENLYVFKGGWEAWQKHAAQGAPGEASTAPDSAGAVDDAIPAPKASEAGGPTDRHESGTQPVFLEVDLKQVVEIFEHEKTTHGAYVFVDARADGPYESGHIPGAIQCDYYRIDYYFPDVMAKAAAAEKIVVYCNGGDCEDSLYVCGELLKADIPRARILLFKGGWQEWAQAGLPVASGREP